MIQIIIVGSLYKVHSEYEKDSSGPQIFTFLPSSPGDEDLPHVPLGEHQRREQVERGREAGREADRQRRSGLQHPHGGQIPKTQLCKED